jgi:hypothetical protein
VAPDYRSQIQRALARQRSIESSQAKAHDLAAARMPAGALTIGDVAEVVGGLLHEQRAELLEHFRRMLQLVELRQTPRDAKEDVRVSNIHRRLTQLESEVRLMTKRGSR